MKAPPVNFGPVGFETFCTVSTFTDAMDTTGAATYAATTTATNVPCTIQPASASEALKFGPGVAHEGSSFYVGYFPSRAADGTAIVIPAEANVAADGVTYRVTAAGSEFADGLQRAALRVVT